MSQTRLLVSIVVLLGLFCQVFSTLPAVYLIAAPRDGISAEQAAGAILPSAAGLQSQLEGILKVAKDRNAKQLDDRISDLQVPESSNWFVVTFGEEIGQNLAVTYKSSWKNYEDIITNIFRESGTGKHTRVFVKEFAASSPNSKDNLIQAILKNAKDPLVLYTAGTGKNRESDSLPGIYVYVEGSFRVVNWRTFYGLPNAKPMRIRVSSQVAQAQLVHQVNPIPPSDAFKRQVHGTVTLHAVIDRDGNVSQLDLVSGPPELVKAAMDAVRQ